MEEGFLDQLVEDTLFANQVNEVKEWCNGIKRRLDIDDNILENYKIKARLLWDVRGYQRHVRNQNARSVLRKKLKPVDRKLYWLAKSPECWSKSGREEVLQEIKEVLRFIQFELSSPSYQLYQL